LDEIIAKRSTFRKRKRAGSDQDESELSDRDNPSDSTTDSDSASDYGGAPTSEEEQKSNFFSTLPSSNSKATSFLDMNLSRPILRALSSLSFEKPTPIQAAAIPVGLLGKDIVGAAVTGSGKTAAFFIPVLERLIHKDKSKHAAATRCLVLVPTRELAIQCFEVGKKLGSHVDVQFCLVVGGAIICRVHQTELIIFKGVYL
jgi:ATP-dependent RNA helicase DDX27